MSKKTVFKVAMLAGAVALAGCTDAIEETPVAPPVDETPVEPPVSEALVILNDGTAATNFSVMVGSNSDSYNRQVLARGEGYPKTDSLQVTAKETGGIATWQVDTFSAGEDGPAEVYFIVGSAENQLDLSEYQNGLLLIDLSVLVATTSETSHQIFMQTNTDAGEDYKNRQAFYFSQAQLADLEADGWTTVAVPMSCFSIQDATGAFDITKVNDLMSFDIRGNESVSYEIGKVAFEKTVTVPAGAVEWSCE
ncbi:hypothetical protein [Agarivorans albus]|uniref:Lipoprotein n=1 Tax=Agarivorans albus MKT 106 TaxID=1331007 RepID=R9PTB9_AGAAL|nr:hypothetical protein [Agarivorans albus]GAD02151.1 hypothetical protein AALB_2231 [Agarivorans albus MKT 106]